MPNERSSLASAIVCTRNRGEQVVDTVRSILANAYSNFELVIVDQSSDDRTETAITPFLQDPRVAYVRSETAGKVRALRIALARSKGEVVALADDDCVVPPDWLEALSRIFEEHAAVAVAFCNVKGAPHDASAGFIPQYIRDDDLLLTSIRDKLKGRGIGAGCAVRRSLLEKIGGFDDLLGPGARFPACEDGDIAVRALLAGYHVYETSTVSVEHFGFRTWAEGRLLAQRDFEGIGAAYSKPLKCGRWDFAIVPLYEFGRFALWPPLSDLLCLRRPRGIMRIGAFLKGFFKGLQVPVDRATLKFMPVTPGQADTGKPDGCVTEGTPTVQSAGRNLRGQNPTA